MILNSITITIRKSKGVHNMTELIGYAGRPIEIQEEVNGSNKIAFLYPGMRYGSDAPLFYYLIRLLKSLKIDICFFEFKWNQLPLNEQTPKEEVISVIKSEIETSIEFIEQKKGYDSRFLISKSVGTLVAETFSEETMDIFNKIFYFTPFIDISKCIKPNTYFYYGGNDPYIDTQYKKDNPKQRCHFYPPLDHSLMKKNDVFRSIEALSNILHDFENDLRHND